MGMLCMLFMDICPDLQMNNSRDVSFYLKLSDNISVHQFNCWDTDRFCKQPKERKAIKELEVTIMVENLKKKGKQREGESSEG